MEQPYSFKEIKTYLQSLPNLKLSRPVEVRNPQAFIKSFLLDYNYHYATVYGNNLTQTERGKRRSIGDIYRVTYHYFPKITMGTVYRTLLTLIADGLAISAICHATHMRVYRGLKKGEYGGGYFNGVWTDEFHVDISQFEEHARCNHNNGSWGTGDDESLLNFITINQ